MSSKNSEEVKRCLKRKKANAVEMMGGCCQICGYDKCLSALEFHHIDASEKELPPSYAIFRMKWETVVKELKKCILVCANCHREIHDKESGINLENTRINYNWVTKECKVCSETFDTTNGLQHTCSNKCRTIYARKVEWPSKEELEGLIENNTWTAIGKMYDVSDNAVRKWAKKYDII